MQIPVPARVPRQLRLPRALTAAPASPAPSGTVYYVSPSGSDSNNGTSAAAPWQTIARVNAQRLNPGDAVLFQGGQAWTGTTLELTWPGTAAQPITIGSYGTGEATIANTSGNAVYGYNVGGYAIENLAIPGTDSGAWDGISFFCSGTGPLPAVTVQNVQASGGWQYGILFGGQGPADGWNGITVSGCDASGNVYAGICTYSNTAFNPSAPAYNHRSVVVSNCTANDNLGSSLITGVFTGSGIILGNCDASVIEYCVTSGNGLDNGDTYEGPVGCWFYASRNSVIENCVSSGNGSGTGADGDGFDLDVDCTGCTVQYNISYGNGGAGILAWGGAADSYWGAGPNTVRYNLTWGNGQNPLAVAGYYGEITPGGNMSNLAIYGNTCVSQPNGSVQPPCLSFPVDGTLENVQVLNNIFYGASGGPVVSAAQAWTTSELYLAGNDYYAAAGTFAIDWGGTAYPSLTAWRAATGNEASGTQALGWDLDPKLASPLTQPAVTTPGSLAPAYGLRLSSASPLAAAGLDLAGFGISPGSQDFFGDALAVPLSAGAYQAAAAAPFPASPLDLDCELNLGGLWTDVSTYVYQREGQQPAVTLTRGRQDESSDQANPGRSTWEWNNRDGRFSPKNPVSPYYGLLGRNTGVRFSVPAQNNYLRLEDDAVSYVSCPPATGLSITGDIDIQLQLHLSDWRNTLLASKWNSASSYRSWVLVLNSTGTIGLVWTPDGSSIASATSSIPLPYGTAAVRATLQVSTGTVTFYTGTSLGGTWTQLGAAQVYGSTSIFGGGTGSAPVTIGYNSAFSESWFNNGATPASLLGGVSEFRLYSGIGGTLEAGPVFSAQSAGATSFADAQGNTWTLNGTAAISSRDYRFHGEMSAQPPKWDVTGADMAVAAQAGGVLRRITQGNAPLDSPMKRAITLLAGSKAPVAYWPMEDAAGATVFGSGIGGLPMQISGSPSLADSSDFACSAPLPEVNGASFSGAVSYAGSWTDNQVFFLLDIPSGGEANGAAICAVSTTGTITTLALFYESGGGLNVTGYNSAGTGVFNETVAFGAAGNPILISIALQDAGGGNITWHVDGWAPGAATPDGASGTVSGTVGKVTGVQFAPTGALTSTAIGHCAVLTAYQQLYDLFSYTTPNGVPTGALSAWTGEPAAVRFARLAAENGYQARIIGAPSGSAAMGAQAIDTLSNLLQACEDADAGQIFEPRQILALGYRTLASMYNQAVAVTLDYAQSEPGGVNGSADDSGLDPTYDDALTRNDWSLTRTAGTGSDGATYQAQLNDGSAMSISPPPVGVGDYADTLDCNVELDSQLADLAWWKVHTGTVDEARWPVIPVNLARPQIQDNSLYYPVLSADIGDFLEMANAPDLVLYDPVQQLAWGMKEALGGLHHTAEWNAVPESPYQVFEAGTSHIATDGTALGSAASSTATSLSFATDAGYPLWTTSAADFPFDVMIAGERVTVTDITGASSPQAATVTRSVNGVVKSQAAGAAVTVYPAAVIAL